MNGALAFWTATLAERLTSVEVVATCAHCRTSYTDRAFRELPLLGFVGGRVNGISIRVETRGCCGSTLTVER